MRKFLALATALGLFGCSGGHPAYAYAVYQGCAAPSLQGPATGKTWYVDPVNGKTPAAGGLGTQAAPWDSLNGVISGGWAGATYTVAGYTRPLLSSVPYFHKSPTTGQFITVADTIGSPPVNPGDSILLMSGNYGDIALGAYEEETLNSGWVTVEAAPGQTPVFDTLFIRSTNLWVFNGIKVQSLLGTNGNNNALVAVSDQGAAFPTSNIILVDLLISTADNTVGWTQAQWVAQGRTGLQEYPTPGNGTNGQPYTTCVSVTASHITQVRTGATVMANQSLFQGNQIDHFGDDGLDYGANDISIRLNKINDVFSIGDGNHQDGMQGQIGPLAAGVPYNAFQNILIDSNTVIRQTDPTIMFPSYLQGIDAFDEDWTNVTVTNNVVVTSGVCWGMEFSSIHNSLIAGNTVVDDGLIVAPGCVTELAVGGKTHEGLASTNTRVTGNLAYKLAVGSPGDTGVTFDNNVATATGGFTFSTTAGAITYYTQAGTDANGNFSPATTWNLSTVFKTWSPSTLQFDMHLIAGSPAIGHGVGIPALDITGATRTPAPPPMTAGAYAYPN